MEDRMIDNMMDGIGRTKELEPAKRKDVDSFKDLSNEMRLKQRMLDKIAQRYIPRAFPFTPPKGGSEPGYNHTQYEYMGAGFNTEIKNGLFAIEVVKDIQNIAQRIQLILYSLFPSSFDNGRYEIQISDQFSQAKEVVDEAIQTLKDHLSTLQRRIDHAPFKAIDQKEMERLDMHVIRMAYDWLNTNRVPKELLVKHDIDIRPEIIARERRKLVQANILPMQLDGILAEPGADRAGGDNVFTQLTNGDFRDRE